MRGMGFSYVSLFRPGLLNRGPTDRWAEKLAGEIFQLVHSSLAALYNGKIQSKGVKGVTWWIHSCTCT